MKIGLSAYNVSARDLVDLTIAADELGFDSLWLGEHVVLPVGYASDHPTVGTSASKHRVGPIVDLTTKLLDPLVALSACAASTKQIDLATGIYLVPLRPAVVTARMVHTLHDLSQGRIVLGVGAGWLEEEFAAVGVPFAGRGRRLVETIEVLRKAWAGGPFEYHGEFLNIAEVQLCDEPISVPIVLGGNSEGALRRAARLGDGWFASGTPDFDDACRLRDQVLELRRQESNEESFTIYARAGKASPALLSDYAAAGWDHVLVWADQVWPDAESLGVKRARLAEAAAELGVVRKLDETGST